MVNDYYKVHADSLHPHEHAPIVASVFPFDARDLGDRGRALREAERLRDEIRLRVPRSVRVKISRWREIGQ